MFVQQIHLNTDAPIVTQIMTVTDRHMMYRFKDSIATLPLPWT